MTESILVTGGAGYIGSHTAVELLLRGYNLVILDNHANSSKKVYSRISEIVASEAVKAGSDGGNGIGTLATVAGDIRDTALVKEVLTGHKVGATIHFAGLKAVGESINCPLDYYANNVCGTLSLCRAMEETGVRRLIFSSSATVYGGEAPVPCVETTPRGTTTNPYGTSKAMVEQILQDLCVANSDWSVVLLRYFNPIGAHRSGLIGEDPRGIPNNLMPYISQVAVGRLKELAIFGNDYPTEDGTCKRDYLHVVDLALGHVKALAILDRPGAEAINLGTGQPRSVLEMVEAFERVTGVPVPYRIAGRREGDLPAVWADPRKAEQLLGWRATHSLDDMMADTWRWQKNNPEGYG